MHDIDIQCDTMLNSNNQRSGFQRKGNSEIASFSAFVVYLGKHYAVS